MSAIKTSGFVPRENKAVTSESLIRECYKVHPGDLLVSRASTSELVGSSCVATASDTKLMLSDKTLRLVVDTTLANPEFINICLGSKPLRRQIEAASSGISQGMQNISQSAIGNLSVLWPPLDYQHHIVEVLESAREAERSTAASITKLLATREAIAESLLGRLTWDASLPDALEGRGRNGFSPAESATWTGVQMLGLGCLSPHGFTPSQLKNAPDTVAADHSAVLSDGDLLMSRANTRDLVGLTGIFRDIGTPCIYPDLMMKLPPGQNTSAPFLDLVLRSSHARHQISAMAQGTSESMVKISADTLQWITIPLPSRAGQEELVKVIAETDKRIAVERSQLAKLRTLCQGLADDLLNGNVRLNDVA